MSDGEISPKMCSSEGRRRRYFFLVAQRYSVAVCLQLVLFFVVAVFVDYAFIFSLSLSRWTLLRSVRATRGHK